jgi:2-keto-4-pentenoate hydratase/2-oxohepta-3-ene-1,7-dioic acid hydratase in catechol pathway
MRFVRFIDQSETMSAPQWGLLEQDQVTPLAHAPYTDWAGDGHAPHIARKSAPLRLDDSKAQRFALHDVRLLAPVTPSKLVCVGRNYAEHAAELGNEVPTEPLIFLKPPSTVIGPDAAVVYPRLSQRVDHEGELAVLIGRRCRHLAEAEAAAVIFGYTIANDVTARDLQRQDGQWTRGKGFDTFAPVGPWIDTDFDPANRPVRCRVNDELRQDGNTNLLIYSIAHVLAYVTAFMTLEPGDLLLTGTPAGVGPVKPGDVMVVEIEGLGQLSNPVVAEETPS